MLQNVNDFVSDYLDLSNWINANTKQLFKNKIPKTIFIDENGDIVSHSEYIAFVFRKTLVQCLVEEKSTAHEDELLKYYKAIAWVLNKLVDAGAVQGFLAPPTFISMPTNHLTSSKLIYVFPHIKMKFVGMLDKVLGFSTNGLFVPEGLYTEAQSYDWKPLFKAAGLE